MVDCASLLMAWWRFPATRKEPTLQELRFSSARDNPRRGGRSVVVVMWRCVRVFRTSDSLPGITAMAGSTWATAPERGPCIINIRETVDAHASRHRPGSDRIAHCV
eukprot:7173956-Pyramimonas_sp.AAC.1